jgi:hypothetical protein
MVINIFLFNTARNFKLGIEIFLDQINVFDSQCFPSALITEMMLYFHFHAEVNTGIYLGIRNFQAMRS